MDYRDVDAVMLKLGKADNHDLSLIWMSCQYRPLRIVACLAAMALMEGFSSVAGNIKKESI